jgi:sugar-specific transcriptional regulator TrmB
MNKQNIENKLKTFGLSSEEITLYLFLLENGSKTLLELPEKLESIDLKFIEL